MNVKFTVSIQIRKFPDGHRVRIGGDPAPVLFELFFE